MRAAVRAAFNAFTEPLEGRMPWMYLDILGLVTTGRGNLIDPMPAALALQWEHRDGSPVSVGEVMAEWKRVKALQSMSTRGGAAFASVTNLRLSVATIDALCLAKLGGIDAELAAAYPGWSGYSADAQMGFFSLSWAMGTGRIVPGPEFQFPHFRTAVLAGDWATAAIESRISNGTKQRNDATRTCFANAAIVEANAMDPDVLYYPKALS